MKKMTATLAALLVATGLLVAPATPAQAAGSYLLHHQPG